MKDVKRTCISNIQVAKQDIESGWCDKVILTKYNKDVMALVSKFWLDGQDIFIEGLQERIDYLEAHVAHLTEELSDTCYR
jgi:hypothetical protein